MQPNTALVTGAGQGIGRATALALASRGYMVVLAGRTVSKLESVQAEIIQQGGQAVAVPCDVTVEPDVAHLISQATTLGGGSIEVLVCGAGVVAVSPFEQLTLADWERTIAVSLTGTFLCCKHAVAHMPPGGIIVGLSSIAGRTGFPHWSAYSAAKFGLMGFLQAIREELRPRGIRVTVVIPGAIDTPLWQGVPGEWNRAHMLLPEDVAQAILTTVVTPPHVQIDEIGIGHIVGKL